MILLATNSLLLAGISTTFLNDHSGIKDIDTNTIAMININTKKVDTLTNSLWLFIPVNIKIIIYHIMRHLDIINLVMFKLLYLGVNESLLFQ